MSDEREKSALQLGKVHATRTIYWNRNWKFRRIPRRPEYPPQFSGFGGTLPPPVKFSWHNDRNNHPYNSQFEYQPTFRVTIIFSIT